MIGHDDVDVMEDRRAAIAYAVQAADARDVVLIAGKGHEDYQEIAGVKQPFSDVDVARALLAARAAGAPHERHDDDAGRGACAGRRALPAAGSSATAASR